MACNAISFTKAAVTDEALLKLLTPDLLVAVVNAALAEAGYTAKAEARSYGGSEFVTAYAGGVALSIRAGKVNASSSYSVGEAEKLSEAVSKAIAQAADALLARQIAATMRALTGKQPTLQTAQVKDGEAVYQANIFTVKI